MLRAVHAERAAHQLVFMPLDAPAESAALLLLSMLMVAHAEHATADPSACMLPDAPVESATVGL